MSLFNLLYLPSYHKLTHMHPTTLYFPLAPWYNDDCKAAKQEKRQAERKWKKSKLTVDRDIFLEKQMQCNKIYDESKKNYYNSKITAAEENSKELFDLTKTLLYRERKEHLPTGDCKDIACKFGLYFPGKIENIRKDFPTSNACSHPHAASEDDMKEFMVVSEKEISKVITSGNSKSCALDPIPTSIVKDNLDILVPVIDKIVNKSLSESKMPTSLKTAIVTPLLKKSNLNKENYKNYRPVSNLPYIGKIIEKAAIQQMETHLKEKDLTEPLQSAYTTHHSVETALLKVSNDILLALDDRCCVYLVLLDLSAAFDTIDHSMFIKRMECEYGMTGGVTSWMTSYLTDRTQSVVVNNQKSDDIHLNYRFPLGCIVLCMLNQTFICTLLSIPCK